MNKTKHGYADVRLIPFMAIMKGNILSKATVLASSGAASLTAADGTWTTLGILPRV